MEVTTMSPPSASPTEGDDPCEIDVTSVAIHSVTLLISLCGLAGNGALFCLLRWKGHTASIFSLAVADFIFLLFALPSALLFLLEAVSCSPILPLMYVSSLYLVSAISCYWALFCLTAISAKKDMKKLCKLCCHCDLSNPMMWVLWGAQCLAFVAPIILIPTVASLCPSHEQEHCRVVLISTFSITLLLFAAPMVITCIINIIKPKCGSQQQQPKRFDVVVILIVLLAVLLSLWNFLQQLGYTSVSRQVFFLLVCIHSTIKPFIYFSAGSSWRPCSVGRCWTLCTVGSLRESLWRVFEDREKNTPSSNAVVMDTVM